MYLVVRSTFQFSDVDGRGLELEISRGFDNGGGLRCVGGARSLLATAIQIVSRDSLLEVTWLFGLAIIKKTVSSGGITERRYVATSLVFAPERGPRFVATSVTV